MSGKRTTGVVIALLAGLLARGHADAPRAVEQNIKVFSQNRQFYALSEKREQRTAVFRAANAQKPVWEIPGYSPVLFLADDGKHLVEGYAGGNILAKDAKSSEALLVFFAGPQRVAMVTINQIFPHIEDLPKTTSGRAWGNYWGFESSKRFVLRLNDGHKVAFDTDSGKRIPE